MPENHTLGPKMTLRIVCHRCHRRRLCQGDPTRYWLCTPCRTRLNTDMDNCRHPKPCACHACWDDDNDKRRETNREAVLEETRC